MNRFARATLASPALGVALDRELILENDGDEGVGGAGLALAVVTVVIANKRGGVLWGGRSRVSKGHVELNLREQI